MSFHQDCLRCLTTAFNWVLGFSSNLNNLQQFLNCLLTTLVTLCLPMSFLQCGTHGWNKIFKLPSHQDGVECSGSNTDHQIYFSFPSLPFPLPPFLAPSLLLSSLPPSLCLCLSLHPFSHSISPSKAKCCLRWKET